MKKYLCPVLHSAALHSSFAQQQLQKKNISRPKLVVGVVVDQMRWDYLYLFYDRYGKGGFKRLMNEGLTVRIR